MSAVARQSRSSVVVVIVDDELLSVLLLQGEHAMRSLVERYREPPILDAESRRTIESKSKFALVPPSVARRRATGRIVHARLHHHASPFMPR